MFYGVIVDTSYILRRQLGFSLKANPLLTMYFLPTVFEDQTKYIFWLV